MDLFQRDVITSAWSPLIINLTRLLILIEEFLEVTLVISNLFDQKTYLLTTLQVIITPSKEHPNGKLRDNFSRHNLLPNHAWKRRFWSWKQQFSSQNQELVTISQVPIDCRVYGMKLTHIHTHYYVRRGWHKGVWLKSMTCAE